MIRSIHFLLATLVVACPLWCTVAKCGFSEVVVPGTLACCCCQSQPQDSDQPQPEPSKPPTQCLCSGAVLFDIYEVETPDFWSAFLLDQTLVSGSTNQPELSLQIPGILEKPVVSGRTLRHHHSSLTL